MSRTRCTTALLAALVLGGLTTVGSVAAGADPAQAITSSPPAAATVGVAYSHTFDAGASGASWATTAGTLPDGLTLDSSSGEVSGIPTTVGTSSPITVTASWTGSYTAVTAGSASSCALFTAGAAHCWGNSAYGQAEDHAGPFTTISAGNGFTCALTPAGAADCWGADLSGGAIDQSGPYVDISAGGFHTCAITSPDGAADCWGQNDFGQAVDQPGPFTAVASGQYHSCALTPAGDADCWGYDDYGQGSDHAGLYSAVTTGSYHSCALTTTGDVDCWGNSGWGQAADHVGPFTAVSAGSTSTCALTVGGAVDCWGRNDDGQSADQIGPYMAVAAGQSHTCAITSDGGIDCWGTSAEGRSADQPPPAGSTDAQTFTLSVVAPTGALTGTVTSGGVGVPSIKVHIYPVGNPTKVATTSTAPNGTWTVPNLPIGTYEILFQDPTATRPKTWLGGTPARTGSTRVTTTTAGTTTADLPYPSLLTGTVTSGGVGVPSIKVHIYPVGNPTKVATTSTAPNGTWTVPNLPIGTYEILFQDPTATRPKTWLGGTPARTGSTRVTTTTAGTTADLAYP